MASSGSAYPEAVGCSCWLQLLQISRQFTRRICGRQAVAAVPIDPEAAAAVPIDPEADKAAAKSCEDIFQAAKEGNVGAVRHFLRVDPGSRERKGGDFRRTPLHWAAKYRGFTALHLAAERGHAPVAEQLISAGATVDAANKGETALHWAALNGHAAVVELLISLGAKVDAADNRGWMPLHCAARGGHAAVVELLISLGAKVDAADNRGETPYDLAKVWGHRQVMGLLRPAKAAVPIDPKATAAVAIDPEADKAAAKNCKDIFQAVEEGNLGAVRHFLRVDPESLEREDVVGWTPLHQAAEQGHVEVVALLLKSGASAEVEDDIDRRPQSCRSHGNCVGEESR